MSSHTASISDSDIILSQYAQDPFSTDGFYRTEDKTGNKSKQKRSENKTISDTNVFSHFFHPETEDQTITPKKKKSKRQMTAAPRRRKTNPSKSFVMSRLQRRGIKLIKISVIDLCKNSINTDSDSDDNDIILNAQYIVKDALDPIMDETEGLVKKISKSLIEEF